MRSFKTITSKPFQSQEEFEITVNEWLDKNFRIIQSGYDRDLGYWLHLQKSDIGFKSTDYPENAVVFECEGPGCRNQALKGATTNQTNSIWYLCNEHNQLMSEGEVWW